MEFLRSERLRASAPRRRGVTLIELLVVLAIIGLTVGVGTVQMWSMWQRTRLATAATNAEQLLRRAPLEMQQRNRFTFVRLRAVASAPSLLELWVDADGDGAFNAALDTLLQSVEFPIGSTGISLSDDTKDTKFETTNWSTNSPDTAERLMSCDFLTRTRNTTSQIQSPATMMITMNAAIDGRLTPKVRVELGVAPVWNVTARRTTL